MPRNPDRFRGLFTNIDAKDVPPAFNVEQVNIGNFTPGRLDVRKGLTVLNGDWGTEAVGGSFLISAFGYLSPHARWVIFESSSGVVYAVRDGRTEEVTLGSGFNVANQICCVQDMYGRLLVFNGIERGFYWKGIDSASVVELGIYDPKTVNSGTAAPPQFASAVSGSGDGPNANSDYWAGYRYVDADGFASNMSELTKSTTPDTTSTITFTYTGGSNGVKKSTQTSRVAYIEFWRTLADAPDKLYYVGRSANSTWAESGPASTFTEHFSDDELLNNSPEQILSVYKPDNFPNARRFVPPPTNKPFVVLFQDRLLFYGRTFYSEGTVATSSSSTTATFTSANVRSEMAGWRLQVIDGDNVYEGTVESVNEGAGTATLTANFAATLSGKSYILTPNPVDEAYNLVYSEVGEPESVPPTNAVRVQASSASNDFETGLIVCGTRVFLLHERHYYTMSYCCEPRLDANISPPYDRGCVNNRCAIVVGGAVYMMDQLGCHRSAGGPPEDLSTGQLRDYFDDTVNWSAQVRKNYFASYEPNQRVVRWHVQHVGDSGVYPTRAICLSTVTGGWWQEEYPTELGGACVTEVDGKPRLVYAAPDGEFLLGFDGTSDMCAQATTGTSTSATAGSTALIDSNASFNESMVGLQVFIVRGSAKGTVRTVASYVSGTRLEVDSTWGISTDSEYVIGGIPYSLKTGCFELQDMRQPATEVARRIRMEHKPTSDTSIATIRVYRNRLSTAEQIAFSSQDPTGAVNYVIGTGDIEIKLRGTRAGDSNDPGMTTIPMDQAVASHGRMSADTYLQLEVEGVQGVDPIAITALDVYGVG